MSKKKIVFIGNSIVNGFPHKRSEGFVSLVRVQTGFDVINKGNNGETTLDILARFEHDVISHHPEMVFIMSGTNDFIYKEAAPAQCMDNIAKMVSLSKANRIIPVIMTPVPVDAPLASQRWMPGAGVDYIWVQEQLKSFSTLIDRYAEENQVGMVDIFAAFSEYAGNVSSTVAYHDGIHPSVEGHKVLAKAVVDYFTYSFSTFKMPAVCV